LPLFYKINKQKIFFGDKIELDKSKDAGTSPKEMFIESENYDND